MWTLLPSPHAEATRLRETTIPSFYHDPRPDPAIVEMRHWTHLWWDAAVDEYDLVTSTYVRDELADGIGERAARRLTLLHGIPLVASPPRLEETVQVYLRNKLMPAFPPLDAVHLALASLDKCDSIVTWNCKHLANPNKVAHIQRINRSLGLHVSRLVTPRAMIRRDEWASD
jgi:hypothetical protein